MRLSRWWLGAGVMLTVGAAMLFSACGGDDDDDDDSSSSAPVATAAGSNSNSGSSGKVDENALKELADALQPPNSSETVRFSAPEGITVGWDSKESVDSLKGFYDDKLGSLGLKLAGTMDSGDTHTWVIENPDNGVSGGVVIGPSGTGTTTVTLTLGVS